MSTNPLVCECERLRWRFGPAESGQKLAERDCRQNGVKRKTNEHPFQANELGQASRDRAQSAGVRAGLTERRRIAASSRVMLQ